MDLNHLIHAAQEAGAEPVLTMAALVGGTAIAATDAWFRQRKERRTLLQDNLSRLPRYGHVVDAFQSVKSSNEWLATASQPALRPDNVDLLQLLNGAAYVSTERTEWDLYVDCGLRRGIHHMLTSGRDVLVLVGRSKWIEAELGLKCGHSSRERPFDCKRLFRAVGVAQD
jgi:hypothetical protein